MTDTITRLRELRELATEPCLERHHMRFSAAMHATLPALLDALEAADDVHKCWSREDGDNWLHRAMEARDRLDEALAALSNHQPPAQAEKE